MRTEINHIYLEQVNQKKKLLTLKNKLIADVYESILKHENLREIHKKIWSRVIKTSNVPVKLPVYIEKIAKKAKKLDNNQKKDDLAVLLLGFFDKNQVNNNSKKVINHELMENTEAVKSDIVTDYINKQRSEGKWFYLASSHDDCAQDHIKAQGKLYVDGKHPKELDGFIKSHNIKTIQEIMNAPVYFITRPNCRHYFVAIETDEVMKISRKGLKEKYHTHKTEGDRGYQTPRKAAIEEYEDRLKMLEGLYAKHPTQELKNKILKTKFLIKKWKNML